MREQRVILEYRVDVTPKRRHPLGGFAEDLDVAFGGLLESGDEAQAGGLARTGRPQHGKKLAIENLQIDPVQGFHITVVTRHPGKLQRCLFDVTHASALSR
jgi:hypothetical protein